MQKILFLRGLPGSGKSTYAKDLCKRDNSFKRVNKDDIRAMIGSQHSRGNERLVKAVRDALITSALDIGFSVIVDDTNYHPDHLNRMYQLVLTLRQAVPVEIMDFDTSIEECIARDALRTGSAHVGENVIRRIAKDRDKWKQSSLV